MNPPPPSAAPAPHASTRPGLGPLLCMLGVGVAATSLFGLPLASRGQRFDVATSYSLVHSVAADFRGSSRVDLFRGWQFWWTWGQLTAGIVVLALTAVLVAGVARRVLGIVVAVLALVLGVLEVVVAGRTPDYVSIQQFRTRGDTILDNASYGLWFGLAGLLLLAAGALVTALQARRRSTTYPPDYPPPGYQQQYHQQYQQDYRPGEPREPVSGPGPEPAPKRL